MLFHAPRELLLHARYRASQEGPCRARNLLPLHPFADCWLRGGVANNEALTGQSNACVGPNGKSLRKRLITYQRALCIARDRRIHHCTCANT